MMKPNHAITIKLARASPRSFERSRIPRRVSTSTRTITIASGPRLWQSPAAALRPAGRTHHPTTARSSHSSFCWQAELRLRHSPGLNSQPQSNRVKPSQTQSNPVKPSQTIGVATACRHNSPLAGHPTSTKTPRHPIRHWSFVIRPASHVATMSSRALAPPSPNLCFICAARPTFGSVANSKFPPKLSMIFHAQ